MKSHTSSFMAVVFVLTFSFIALLVLGTSTAQGQVYITGVNPVIPPEDPGYFGVDFFTSYEDALAILPPTTTITVSEGPDQTVTLTWQTEEPWFPYAFGNYQAVGTFDLPAGVEQADPPIPLEVTTRLRMESGRGTLTLDWEGFYQPGMYYEETMMIEGEERIYHYYVPSSYDGSEPVPILFDFHGGGSYGLSEWTSSRTDRFAEKEGFIVVAPDYSYSYLIPFFSAILDKMEADYNIDTRRIYVTGISMGGGATSLLAIALSDRVTAISPLSGGYTTIRDGALPRPMTVVLFGGTEEWTYRDLLPGMLETAEGLVQQFDCDPDPEITEIPTDAELDLDELPFWVSPEDCEILHAYWPTSVIRYRWSGGLYGTEVIVYGVIGGGHAWPGGTQYVVPTTVGITTYLIDATQQIWEHLKDHRIPIEVNIDIKPGSFPNPINLGSKGVIPVAILTTDDFDATTVEADTVRFGPARIKPEKGYKLCDVDGDGDMDMLFKFRTQETGIQMGDTSAMLDGRSFFGSDSIKTLLPKKKGQNE